MTGSTPLTPLDFPRLEPEEQIVRSRAFYEEMKHRRTVREFAPDPVPFELIENAIKVAASAPSGANQQPWTFIVVGSAAIKRQIREAAGSEERENAAQRLTQEWLGAVAPQGTDWRKPHLEQAPYLIIVFMQPYGLREDGEKIKHYYATESVGIAVGMLLAALHHCGLATLTHTPNPMSFLSEILQRPTNERAYVVIPVGYPAPNAQVPNLKKKPLEQVMITYLD